MSNLERLGPQLEGILRTNLSGVLEGAEADLAAYARAISMDLLRIAALGADQAAALRDELLEQADTLVERNRLRVVNGAWRSARGVVGAVFDLLLAVA